jgi:hypothetical protein
MELMKINTTVNTPISWWKAHQRHGILCLPGKCDQQERRTTGDRNSSFELSAQVS